MRKRWSQSDVDSLPKGRKATALPVPTEAAEHTAVVAYIRAKYPLARVHHSMNEGARGWQGQRMIKTHGVSKGYPDLIIYDWRGPRILHMELKRVAGSKISPEQREWLAWLTAAGYVATLCRGYDEATKAVDEFFRN